MEDIRSKEELKEFQIYLKNLSTLFKEFEQTLKGLKKVALYSEMFEFKHKFEQIIQDINLDLRHREERYASILKAGLLRASQELEEALKDSLEWEISAKSGIDLYAQEARIREISEQVDKLHPNNFKLR